MRVTPIDIDELDERGRDIYQAISGPRGGVVDGPFRAWLKGNPELAARMNDVGNALRVTGKLDKRLFEIAVLSVARFWDAHYQWSAHGPLALQLGLTADTIQAIGEGRRPDGAQPDEQLVFDLTEALLRDRHIPQDLYDRVLELVGFEQMVELISTIGQYSLAAIVINGFEIEPIGGGARLPDRH